MAGLFVPSMFYNLPCVWKRQVCMVKYLASSDVDGCRNKQHIYRCPNKVRIVHFNCNAFQTKLHQELRERRRHSRFGGNCCDSNAANGFRRAG